MRSSLFVGALGLVTALAMGCAAPVTDSEVGEDEIKAEAGTTLLSEGGLELKLSLFPKSNPAGGGPLRADISRAGTKQKITLACTFDVRTQRTARATEVSINCGSDSLRQDVLILVNGTKTKQPSFTFFPVTLPPEDPHHELFSAPEPIQEGEYAVAPLRVVRRSNDPQDDVQSFADYVMSALEPLFEKRLPLPMEDGKTRLVQEIAFLITNKGQRTCGTGWISPVDGFVGAVDTTKDVCVMEKNVLVSKAELRKRFEDALEKPEEPTPADDTL